MINAESRSNELATSEKPGSRGLEKPGRQVKAAGVINSINRINFHGGHVFVRLRHIWNNSFITVAAKPAPGEGAGIQLSWDEAERALSKDLYLYDYCGVFYTDGLKMVWLKAGLIAMDTSGLTLAAPQGGDEVNERKNRRYPCLEIATRLAQGPISLRGVMKDYSAAAFAVIVAAEQQAVVREINVDMPVNIVLADGDEVLLAATCRIVRTLITDKDITIVLAPVAKNISRFKPKKYRGIRQNLRPQPSIEFNHPFSGKKVSLKAVDISGSGISVEEDSTDSLLMAGMIIPAMAITFAKSFQIQCRTQVLYNRCPGEEKSVQAGLVFTEMDGENQLQLASILFQAKNERSYVGTDVDQDELWDFFFETGFIYPNKYKAIEAQKGKFKALYSRLYKGCPDIARHIIYRDKGVINGHVSMFRYYRKTWILHHHAAIRSSQHKAGLVVMDHILQHINEVHHFADAAMNYIACYFQPNNRFAKRVFGGAAGFLQDPRKSSLDEFAYFHHVVSGAEEALPDGWVLANCDREDFAKLNSYYNETSGGLMLESLDLEKEGQDEAEINCRYRERGLKRERKFYSLKNKAGRLEAMFILNFSDAGLNMSSLTDCIQVMVIDQEKVGSDQIESGLDILGVHYGGEVPVLLFPRRYADDNGLAYEKVYTLGILNLHHMSKFLGFMASLTTSPLRLAKK